MAFNSLLAHVSSLITSDANVDDSIPCKSDILTLRDCVKGATKEKCQGLQLDLMQCMAKFNVDETEKVRIQIGIANYNEYLRELEGKFGKEKAAEIVAEPVENLKKVEAAQMMYRLDKNQHPKGAPKTKEDLALWTQADQSRLEMGEKAYWDSVRVFAAEFGPHRTDELFRVRNDAKQVADAIQRLAPGIDAKEVSAKTFSKFDELMEPVREKTPGNPTVDDLIKAFKQAYPTKASFDAKLS